MINHFARSFKVAARNENERTEYMGGFRTSVFCWAGMKGEAEGAEELDGSGGSGG